LRFTRCRTRTMILAPTAYRSDPSVGLLWKRPTLFMWEISDSLSDSASSARPHAEKSAGVAAVHCPPIPSICPRKHRCFLPHSGSPQNHAGPRHGPPKRRTGTRCRVQRGYHFGCHSYRFCAPLPRLPRGTRMKETADRRGLIALLEQNDIGANKISRPVP
jgi:hypothetical protein